MRTIRDIPSLHNTTVLLRAPLNEPVVNGHVASDFRIRRAIATIEFLAKAGARVVVCSHIGRAPTETLKPVYDVIAERLPNVTFSPESIGPSARATARALTPGDILILENLRQHPGEVANDSEFSRELAQIADVFVQDAFDTCHRHHASIVGVPTLLPTYAGLLLVEEVQELSTALTPEEPALAIIGGAKFVTKEPVIKKMLELYEHVFVGGALANDFLFAKKYPLGASLLSGADKDLIETLLHNDRLVLPEDVIVAEPDADVSVSHISALDAVKEKEAVLDAGPQTQATLGKLTAVAKTILWNGPLGHYENGFTDGTKALAQAIGASTAHSIVGGGDTITAIEELGIEEHFSFISTGGGAMLAFLTHGTLPGIDAVLQSEKCNKEN